LGGVDLAGDAAVLVELAAPLADPDVLVGEVECLRGTESVVAYRPLLGAAVVLDGAVVDCRLSELPAGFRRERERELGVLAPRWGALCALEPAAIERLIEKSV
jgi:hypothetical protein